MPRAGRVYAAGRNTDEGPGARNTVSELSPYIRRRLVTEWEVVTATVDRHGAVVAEKFIQEVFWRTYWKGWLERRPSVWSHYLASVERDRAAVSSDDLSDAMSGRTGFECFDFWARELVQTGYLHNHARMWFASIWIHTLGLPWSLGAAFFLEHLLDGDPASNTLSWRWVAGLQTIGKTYLAREDNIAKYTNGRFPRTPGLASHPRLIEADGALADTQSAPLPVPAPVRIDPNAKVGLLLTDEDLAPDPIVPRPLAIAGMASTITGMPGDFAASALKDRLNEAPLLDGPEAVAAWAEREGLDTLATAYAPVGPTSATLDHVAAALDGRGIQLLRVPRRWDGMCWPHATKGFFSFKKNIPSVLTEF